MEVALELEKQALADEYFISRHLCPNLDFYSGLVYNAMGFPADYFAVLFAIPRCAGWIAHWVESIEGDQKIFRPRQIYTGHIPRPYVPVDERPQRGDVDSDRENPLRAVTSNFYTRRNISMHGFSLPKTAGKQDN